MPLLCFKTGLRDALHVLDVSTVIMMSSCAPSLPNAVSSTANAPVRQDSEAMIVQSRYVAPWLTARNDLQEKDRHVTAKMAGRESIAMFAALMTPAMQ